MPSNSHNTISRSTQCYPCSSIWLSSKPWNNRTSKQNNIRNTHSIWASGILQRNIPRCISSIRLSILYTADIPTNEQLTTSTFADDTAILSRSRCPGRSTTQLANHLSVVERWLSDWRIKINEQKRKHIKFTLNRQTCPHWIIRRFPKSTM